MGERADGDLVDPRLRNGSDGVEGDAAGGLEPRAPSGQVDGFAQLIEAHVVEKDRVDADGERLCDLVERVALELDRQRRRGTYELHGRGHRAGGAQVVVLHEHRVVEAETVVAAAAAGDGVLLKLTEAGSRLACVEDGGARAL